MNYLKGSIYLRAFMIMHYALCIMNYLKGSIYLRAFMIMHYALCTMNYLKGSIYLRSYKQEFGGFLSHCNIATDNT